MTFLLRPQTAFKSYIWPTLLPRTNRRRGVAAILLLSLLSGLELSELSLQLRLLLRRPLVVLEVAVGLLVLVGRRLVALTRLGAVLDVGEAAAERGGQHGGGVERVGRTGRHAERRAARGPDERRASVGSSDDQLSRAEHCCLAV